MTESSEHQSSLAQQSPEQSVSSNQIATATPHNTSTITTATHDSQDASRRQPASSSSASAELSSVKIGLYGALRHFPDFPIAGINFIDIMPLFLTPTTHDSLLRALELQAQQFTGPDNTPDIVVGLDARGFLFGPSLALRLGAGFVAVRKKGKLPGPCVTAAYEKEYGADYFQIQDGAIKPGQKVLVVDDIIATGGSASAAGELVTKLGGNLLGYMFILEISFLKGREKLGGKPVVTLLEEAEA